MIGKGRERERERIYRESGKREKEKKWEKKVKKGANQREGFRGKDGDFYRFVRILIQTSSSALSYWVVLCDL